MLIGSNERILQALLLTAQEMVHDGMRYSDVDPSGVPAKFYQGCHYLFFTNQMQPTLVS